MIRIRTAIRLEGLPSVAVGRFLILTLALAAVLLLSGCGVPSTLAQTAVPFSTIQKGQSSGIGESLQIVVRDQAQWNSLWARHSSIRTIPSGPPSIDFSAEMVTGLFAGQKSTGGYTVEITRVAPDGSNLRVYYREQSPPRDAMVTQALTQPFHLVRLPTHPGPVVFTREGS